MQGATPAGINKMVQWLGDNIGFSRGFDEFAKLFSAGMLAVSLVYAKTGTVQRPPNVVFIPADDLGIGGLNGFGMEWLEIPNLDRLCSEGLISARAGGDWCTGTGIQSRLFFN
jgi:hypothetical protein